MRRWKTFVGVGAAGWMLAANPVSAQRPAPAPVVKIPVDKPVQPTTLPQVESIRETSANSDAGPKQDSSTDAKPTAPTDLPPLLLNDAPKTSAEAPATSPVAPLAMSHPIDSLCQPTCSRDVSPRDRFYGNFEFLYWATQGVHVVPLLTTSHGYTGGVGDPGAIGSPMTQVLFGGGRMLNGFRPGFRVEAGYWLDDHEALGVSARFFSLGRQGEGLAGGSDGTQLLAIPVIVQGPGAFSAANTVPGPLLPPVGTPLQRATYVGLPGNIQGTVDVHTSTDFLGGSLDLRHGMTHTDLGRLEFFGGYRTLYLGDSLNESFDAALIRGGTPTGARFMGYDSWRSRNYFHGAELGMHVTRYVGPVSATLETSLAMGVTGSNLDTNQTRTLGSLDSQTSVYQVGKSDNTTFFGVVPEVALKLGWQCNDMTRLTAGYNFLYWSRVRRAQEQYDLTAVTPNQPTDFWAQGWNLGVEVRY